MARCVDFNSRKMLREARKEGKLAFLKTNHQGEISTAQRVSGLEAKGQWLKA